MICLHYRRFQVHTPAIQELLNHEGLEPMHTEVDGKLRINSNGFWIRPQVHWFLAIQWLTFLFPAEESKTIQAPFALLKKEKNKNKQNNKKTKTKPLPSYPVIAVFRSLPFQIC